MRLGWHKWWLSALVSACVLNPHPDPPGERGSDPGGPASQAGSRNASAGAPGGNGSVGMPAGGSLSLEPDLPGSGDAGDRGASAGDSGMSEGGAPGEGGAAGADQLAPGPPK